MRKLLLLLFCTVLGYSRADDIFEYKVKMCLLANIKASLKIPNEKILYNVASDGDSTNGDCRPQSNKSSLMIPFQENVTLTINFDSRSDGVFLSVLTVEYDDPTDTSVVLTNNVQERLSSDNEYYLCNQTKKYTVTGSDGAPKGEVTFEYAKIQAFGIKDGKYSKEGKVCSDKGNSTTLPPTTQTPTTVPPSTPTTHPTTSKPAPTGSTTPKIVPTTHPSTNTPTPKPKPTPTPKPTPKPKEVEGNVTDPKTQVVCILVKFTGTLDIPYTEKGANKTYHYPIEAVKNVSGECGKETETIKFTLENDWILSMSFSKTAKKKASRRLLASDGTYYMNEVMVQYNIPGVGAGTDKSDSKDRNEAEVGQSYQCTAKQDISMEKGTNFTTRSLEVEAFRTAKTGKFSGNAKLCNADISPGSNIVPIVVGVVLALLVVIIIVAYLIGRRRTQSGYQSV